MAERNRNHYVGAVVLDGGGNLGIARLADSFALALESGALTATVSLTRTEVRELSLRLLDASQINRNGEE